MSIVAVSFSSFLMPTSRAFGSRANHLGLTRFLFYSFIFSYIILITFLPTPPCSSQVLLTFPHTQFQVFSLSISWNKKEKKGKEKKIKMNKKPVRQNIQNKVGSLFRVCRRTWAWGLPRGMVDVLSDVPAEETWLALSHHHYYNYNNSNY